MIEQINVNNKTEKPNDPIREILDACNREFKNKNGENDYQEGIKIFKKYFNKENPIYDINLPLKGQSGWTALAFATFFGKTEEAKALMSLGAKPEIKLKDDITVLHIAATEGKPPLCGYFLKTGIDVNSPSSSGVTPMMNACESGHMDVIQVLMNFKPNIMLQDKDLKTCLDYSLKKEHYNIVRYIEYFYLQNKIPLKGTNISSQRKVKI